MIGVFNGPQGMYAAAEGLEQKLFQVGKNIVLFDGEISPRLVRSIDAYKDDVDGLVHRIANEYDKGTVLVCSGNNKQTVYAAGKRQMHDVSAGYASKVIDLDFSATSLNDFVDFVEHSQATQFGFVICDGARMVVSSNVKLSVPAELYAGKELCEFSKIVFSWFNTFMQGHPSELKVYLQNLCSFDVREVSSWILSSDEIKSTSHDAVIEKLLVGTAHYKYYQEFFDLLDESEKLSDRCQELYQQNIARLAKLTVARNETIVHLHGVIKKLDAAGSVTRVLGQDYMSALDKTIAGIRQESGDMKKRYALTN